MLYRRHYYQAERHLQALAFVSGKTVDEFLFDHSNFAAEGRSPGAAPCWLNWQMRRRSGKHLSESKRPHLCRECISQQALEFGIPFWHRQHQLDGLYWCPIHKTPLLALDDWLTKDALVPVAAVASLRTPATADDYENYPALRSFSEIMIGFLRRPLWRSVERIDDCLRRQAILRGLYTEDGVVPRVPDDSPFLSDLAFGECPAWWLDEVFGLQSATAGKGRSALNRVFSRGGRAPSVSYALALCLLLSPRERAEVLDESAHRSGR